jgi:hypothetical protein
MPDTLLRARLDGLRRAVSQQPDDALCWSNATVKGLLAYIDAMTEDITALERRNESLTDELVVGVAHIDTLTAADAWAEVRSAIGEGFVVTVTLNTLGTYVAAAWPGGNYVGDPAYLTDRPEATADAALRALARAILRGEQ